jgi:outer membrane PBP1 activator LpoA protein
MPGITLKQAQEHLQAWLKAELEISTSQSYKIGTRSLTRADLSQVREQIKYWQGKVAELENAAKGRGRNRVFRAVPFDF